MNNAKEKLVLPELSYDIVGAAFEVCNSLGWGLSEKHYQQALAKEPEDKKIRFKKEVFVPLAYKERKLGKYFADFMVEGKILLELKAVPKFGYVHSRQILGYLRSANLRLGILIYFGKEGVKYHRVLDSQYFLN